MFLIARISDSTVLINFGQREKAILNLVTVVVGSLTAWIGVVMINWPAQAKFLFETLREARFLITLSARGKAGSKFLLDFLFLYFCHLLESRLTAFYANIFRVPCTKVSKFRRLAPYVLLTATYSNETKETRN